ncbi:hypothetical protein PRZ48_009375 [Zasmidium cellare]|uniref:4'-phosphopantetheinyl transferase domain-containing protein n=1 Tax=Zasmidium cellare TaxID=395010 RepID=A0ABR0EC71_ZASCE|nr:hypothetical protein PRZ48_009375 [Zasmidium cellare]
MSRFLTRREQNDFWRKFGTVPKTGEKQFDAMTKHLAGRWAAKEAVIKAVGYRRLTMMDVEILRSSKRNVLGGVFALIRDPPRPSDPGVTDGSGGNVFPSKEHAATRRFRIVRSPQDAAFGASDEGVAESETLEEALGENSAARKAVPTESSGLIRTVQSTSKLQDVSYDSSSNPNVESRSLEEVYGELEGQIAKVSISHDTGYATAVCLAADEPMDGDVGGEAAARMP